MPRFITVHKSWNPSSRAAKSKVLTLNFPPYAWCDEAGQVNPPGYISDLWAALNDFMRTDIEVVCGDLDTSFNDAVQSVSDNVYPVMTACGLTYERLQLDITATVGVDVSGYRFVVLSSSGSALASLFAPIFTPIAVNLLAILLLSHVVFANLIYCTQHYGNSRARTKSYSSQALSSFYFSVLGYDLTAINTSLGRLLAGIDTLLQSILMALYVGVVTVESISSSGSDFDPTSLEDYTVACQPDTRTWDWLMAENATGYPLDGVVNEYCLEALQAGHADACCTDAGTMAVLLKSDTDNLMAAVDGTYNESDVVMYVQLDYAETTKEINEAIQWLREKGFIATLYDTYLTPPVSGWGSLDVDVALWASVALVVVGGWLVGVIVSKMTETMRKRKVKRELGLPTLSV
ncbi:hypothetical protein KIPB_009363 [Kipferlia bialata]|uniref:Solute-binding protein family 3/N-terminal domain-containing protein n=1 Tax=Kipferlia bialata TaxID=797122 RepID=A0A9K3GKK7_9EUKA|nr:hypothetical protein KIPB_009363 [Kipferlia bialata]|eukprot:g9363.t1